MSHSTSITNVNDEKIVQVINQASRRVLYMAPGLSEAISDALSNAWSKLGVDAVTVILDVDPEVYRLGYGTVEGLNKIRLAATSYSTLVCKQPGVRIGLLIADNTTLIYTPTPLLIEAGTSVSDKPNAIKLNATPQEVARDLGIGENSVLDRAIGLDHVKPQEIQKVEADLKSNPPVKFDLARKVRVFTSKFQFVEFEMTGCFISRKRVRIPSHLVGLANNPDMQSQFHAHFNLVNNTDLKVTDGTRVLTEEFLQDKKREIIKSYLISLPSYGNIVLRGNKEEFEDWVECLRADVKLFKEGVADELQKNMGKNASALVDALLPAVQQNPPKKYTKIYGSNISKEQLRIKLEEDILESFGCADNLVEDMIVKLIFKDIAYESLIDEKFLSLVHERISDVESIHVEYDAAKASKTQGA